MATFAEKKYEPTKAQQNVIDSTTKSVAVVAGAGSGKTETLIHRFIRAIDEDWQRLDNILAITFTDKAANELKIKLREHVPNEYLPNLECAWIGTFHSFSARLIRKFAPKVGIDPSFGILDENQSGFLIREAIKTSVLDLLSHGDELCATLVDAIDYKNVIRILNQLIAFRWHATKALSQIEESSDVESRLLFTLKHVFVKTTEHINEIFAQRNELDFQELEIKSLELLGQHPDILGNIQRQFHHLLVDEFQDTNDIQTEIVRHLFNPKINNLCIVGDPRQSIYRFRGANPRCFSAMIGLVMDSTGKYEYLAHNFRSHPHIVEFVNTYQSAEMQNIFGNNEEKKLVDKLEDMLSGRKFDDELALTLPSVTCLEIAPEEKILTSDRRAAEASAIASHIRTLVDKEGSRYGDMVCLFQSLRDIWQYETAFRAAQIPFRVHGGIGLLTRPEVIDLLNVLDFASNTNNEIALLAILRSPLFGLSDEELLIISKDKGSSLYEKASNHPKCKTLQEIVSTSIHLRPSEIIRYVVELTQYDRICEATDLSGSRLANIEQLQLLALSIEHAGPTTLAEFVEYIKNLRDEESRLGDPPVSGDNNDSLLCMTVHSSKGLEFPIVILPDLFRKKPSPKGAAIFARNTGVAFKLKDPDNPFGPRKATNRFTEIAAQESDEDSNESKRLLYVAMTRAKDQLILPIHTDLKPDKSWHGIIRPIIDKALCVRRVKYDGPDTCISKVHQIEPFIPDIHTITIHKSSSEIVRFTVSQLECMERCPVEYLLRYELGLPSNQLTKKGSDKIPANIIGSIVHSVLEKIDPKTPSTHKPLIKAECISLGIIPNNHIVTDIEKLVTSALSLPIMKETKLGRHEFGFEWSIEGMIIRGTIDCLLPTTEGHIVIDFKTDDVSRDEVPARAQGYELQMLCYAVAAEVMTKKPTISTRLIFIRPIIEHITEINERLKKDTIDRIVALKDKITKKDFSLRDTKPPCHHCPYFHNKLCNHPP